MYSLQTTLQGHNLAGNKDLRFFFFLREGDKTEKGKIPETRLIQTD